MMMDFRTLNILILIFNSWANSMVMEDEETSKYKLVCRVDLWALEVEGGNDTLTPNSIDPYLCTHIIVGMGFLNADLGIDEFQMGKMSEIMGLKERNPDLQVMYSLALGMEKRRHMMFDFLLRESDAREQFVTNTIAFLREHGFDGLNVRWVIPRVWQVTSFATMIQDLSGGFANETIGLHQSRIKLSVTLPARFLKIGDVREINDHVDFVNLLTFKYFSYGTVIHPSGLYGDESVSSSVNQFLRLGGSREKLVIGISFKGSILFLKNNNSNSIGSETRAATMDDFMAGRLTPIEYRTICSMMNSSDTITGGDDSGPYLVDGDRWIGYDNEASVTSKTEWLKNEGLGGAMVMDLTNDDWNGASCNNGPFPLTHAIKRALG